VTLGDGEPIPYRIRGHGRIVSILAEIPQDVPLEVGGNRAQTDQPMGQSLMRVRHAPEGGTGTEALQLGLPGSRIPRVL
jgi:hypothetical protein